MAVSRMYDAIVMIVAMSIISATEVGAIAIINEIVIVDVEPSHRARL